MDLRLIGERDAWDLTVISSCRRRTLRRCPAQQLQAQHRSRTTGSLEQDQRPVGRQSSTLTDAIRARYHADRTDPINPFAEERFKVAAGLLEPPLRSLVRIGGTNAQREVFHETLLHAHLRAGEREEAQQMLEARLGNAGSFGDNAQARRLLALSGVR
jgi:hypothetical protein